MQDPIECLSELRQQRAIIDAEMLRIVSELVGQPLGPQVSPTGQPASPRPSLDGLGIVPAAVRYLEWTAGRTVTIGELHSELSAQRVLAASGKEIRNLTPRKGSHPKIGASWKAVVTALAHPTNAKHFRIYLPDGTEWRTGVRFATNFVIRLA